MAAHLIHVEGLQHILGIEVHHHRAEVCSALAGPQVCAVAGRRKAREEQDRIRPLLCPDVESCRTLQIVRDPDAWPIVGGVRGLGLDRKG